MKNYASLKQIQQDIQTSKTSCKELVEGYLNNISNQNHLNAFIEVYAQEAIDSASKIDKKLKNNQAGKLAGLVIGIKDNICYKNHESSASSRILSGFKSTYSATAVNRLINEDAIVLGRLNCDEFAMGSSNENSIYGPARNPINTDYVPGGSSGGSAAAVKANLCHAALGTDTGGSIRQPAAFCGVMGLKPTYGLVSRYGLIAYASSFDQIGPIAKSTDDIFQILNIMSGKDNFDSTCVDKKMAPQKTKNNNKKTFAVIKEALDFPEMHDDIKMELDELIRRIKSQGHKINYINLPLLDYLVPSYYILTTAEASSNLSRYDGIKYGFQKEENNLDSLIKKTRTIGFGPEVKRRILLGTFVLSHGYYNSYYSKAQKIRRLIKNETQNILSANDYILLPTTPNLPFKLGEKNLTPTQLYYEDVFTVHANLSGHPAISFPLGMVENNFFASAQLIGNYFSEPDLLSITQNIFLDSKI